MYVVFIYAQQESSRPCSSYIMSSVSGSATEQIPSTPTLNMSVTSLSIEEWPSGKYMISALFPPVKAADDTTALNCLRAIRLGNDQQPCHAHSSVLLRCIAIHYITT